VKTLRSTSLLALGLILLSGLLSCAEGPKSGPGMRIVVLSPEVAEIIAALGAADEVVGITEECDFPPELAQKPKVGNFGAVKREAILALKPDLIFTSALEQEALTQELRKLKLPVQQIYPQSLADLPRSVIKIGALIGKQEEARILADSLETAIREIRALAVGKNRPRVYVEIYRDPLMSVADGSFVGELVETSGGDNIFSRLERDYARVDAEDVVAAKPDIMICYSQDTLANILARKGWQDIPAIRDKRIYFEADIDPDWILQATPRSILGMRKLQEIMWQ